MADSPGPDLGIEGIVADRIRARAAVGFGSGDTPSSTMVSVLVLDFFYGDEQVCTVSMVASTAHGMRKLGVIMRDAANGAAKALERAQS